MISIKPNRYYRAPAARLEGGWLEPDALCAVEEAVKAEIAAPAGACASCGKCLHARTAIGTSLRMNSYPV